MGALHTVVSCCLLTILITPFSKFQVLADSQQCKGDCGWALSYEGVKTCRHYYHLLENALLMNGSDNLYALQRVFFPTNSQEASEVDIRVTITADVVGDGNCGSDSGHRPTFKTPRTQQ